MAKRKRRKVTSSRPWKAIRGFIGLLTHGILSTSPLLTLGLIGFGIFWGIRENLYADPGFLIHRIEVVPEGKLFPDQTQVLERTYLGHNLLRVSPEEVARRIQGNPQIQQARVTRSFPGTLRIEVWDRSTFAQVQPVTNGPYYSVAEDGVVLEAESGRNKGFPLIELFEVKVPSLQKGSQLPFRGFREAVALTRAFRQHPLGRSEMIERIRLDHLGNVALVLAKGPELRFGRDPMRKLNTLDSLIPLLKGPERSQIIYIELQYEDLIVKKK